MHKLQMLTCSNQQDTFGTKYGTLPNPGKSMFLKLSANSVRDVNNQQDENGMSFAQKEMIRCGLAKQTNVNWQTN